MEQKIQLRHPAGKHAISMDKVKYETMKKAFLNSLKKKDELTHTAILHSITEDFKKNKIKFAGSIEWHMEWIKLDLEAGKIIERISDKSPHQFRLAQKL
jgi:hypothetical protein